MRILLPVDGSIYSDLAVDEIVKRPWPSNSEIKVITVAEIPVMIGIEPWVASAEYLEVIENGVRSNAQDLISKAIARLNAIDDKTLKVSTEIIEGAPRQAIVDEAEKWNADLIVMGSRGLGAWSRLLLGSVSSAVVHHAKCSVEIVRTRKRE
jgi:nucleotide-binding universal stress UspA family protein